MKLHKRTIRQVPLAHKTVLVRVDYNVPLDENGQIRDDFRIRASLATIKKLLADGCKVVLISHLGRPKGTPDPVWSLEPTAKRLAELLGQDVRFADDCIGKRAEMAAKKAPPKSVIMFENLRFHNGEKANDMAFARQIVQASGADYFVQDGFGVVHRAHASTDVITQCLPSVAGLLLEREYNAIVGAIARPRRPLLALLGGAKVADKIDVINKLVTVSDQIILGGAMANTFLAYKGYDMGASMVEADETKVIKAIYRQVEKKVGPVMADNFFVLPSDVMVGSSVEATKASAKAVGALEAGDKALDLGPKSIKRMAAAIERSQTVIWNGTLGFAENKTFSYGSRAAAETIAHQANTTSVIGGGDTAAFVRSWDKKHGDSFSHVSTGGGASLDLMAGKKLPGVEVLLDK